MSEGSSGSSSETVAGRPSPPAPDPRTTTEGLAHSLQLVCDEALTATDSDTCLLFVPDGADVICVAAAGRGRSLVGWRLPKQRALARICFDTKAPLVIDDVLTDRRADAQMFSNLGTRSYTCAPVLVRSLAAAALEVHSHGEGSYGPLTTETMVALSHRATSAFRRSIRAAGPLTRPRLSELPGAVAYQERLASIRTECDLAALLVVVVGPPLEAAALHLVRDVLMTQRASDHPFVVDADAFAVIMPDTPREGGRIAAKRIGGVLRDRGLGRFGLGTAEIGDDPFTSHKDALTDALTDLSRPPPPILP